VLTFAFKSSLLHPSVAPPQRLPAVTDNAELTAYGHTVEVPGEYERPAGSEIAASLQHLPMEQLTYLNFSIILLLDAPTELPSRLTFPPIEVVTSVFVTCFNEWRNIWHFCSRDPQR
jgi:hypothetical protein